MKYVMHLQPFFSTQSKRYIINLLIGCFLFFSNPLFAQWVQTSGPEGGRIFKLHQSQDRLLACTSGGMYSSDNFGESWQKADSGIELKEVYDVIETENYFFTFSKDLYRSPKDDFSWTPVFTGSSIFAAANGTDYLFAAEDGNLIRSTDDGDSWETVTDNDDNPIGDIYSMDAHNSVLIAFLVSPDFSERTLMISYDSGNTWTILQSILDDLTFVDRIAFVNNEIFITYENRIYLSNDNGVNWTQGTFGTEVNGVLNITYNNNTYYSFHSKKMMESLDGINWTDVESFNFKYTYVEGLVTEAGIMLASTNGPYYSLDWGESWEARYDNIVATFIYEIKRFGNAIYASGDPGIFRSSDNGQSWAPLILSLIHISEPTRPY